VDNSVRGISENGLQAVIVEPRPRETASIGWSKREMLRLYTVIYRPIQYPRRGYTLCWLKGGGIASVSVPEKALARDINTFP